ncbi:MAG: type II CRISPR RNA-guided endonuclease Cas9 [Paramuribaculum sp.]|nr:type II CRISPR RNA-guided endonuclease Cas9 [Paramuribaculum sp.]
MKQILGLDLGHTSIGWGVVIENEEPSETSSILGAGVRRVPLSVDETKEFTEGKSITTNAGRRQKRSARLNKHRYKLRRHSLKDLLLESGFINENTVFAETGSGSTFSAIALRAKAATQEISLEELGKVLMMLNKKRGYKSNRKMTEDVGNGNIDTLEIATMLKSRNITPGEYSLELYENGKKSVPDFYKSDLIEELKRICVTQHRFNPLIPENIIDSVKGKNESQTWAILASALNLKGVKRVSSRGLDKRIEECRWRVTALTSPIGLEQFATIVSKLNAAASSASGLLSEMSERSKELLLNSETIGQYKFRLLSDNPHHSFKNVSFYRQDYIAEFNTIWETQAKFHPELTDEIKEKIKETIIFYQRPLKSQKSKVAYCELGSGTIMTDKDGKKRLVNAGPKVAPKSSPYFQQFRIWQTLNNLKIDDKPLTLEEKQLLACNLEFCDKMSGKDIMALLAVKGKNHTLNIKEIEGNHTSAAILHACEKIAEITGHSLDGISTYPSLRAKAVAEILEVLGINKDILFFNPLLSGEDAEMQPAYRLWHLLYSAEADDSRSGNEKLKKTLCRLFNFNDETVLPLSSLTFPSDYASISVRAIKKLLPYLMKGQMYSEACQSAGLNHSKRSLTSQEIGTKVYADHIENLKKNSLRSPVVEKILNQMINVVNALVAQYGHFDEIRVEMARELKKSAKERENMTKSINDREKDNSRISEILKAAPFNIAHPTRNDIIRYRLYEELEMNRHHTLYSDIYIRKEELFTNKFNVEHIIPKSLLFDDSFANKTLESAQANLSKGNMTAYDYVLDTYGEVGIERYTATIDELVKNGALSPAKAKKLKCTADKISSDFLNRDLALTQYISKKAIEMLEEISPKVTATTGAVTDKLRQDWGLIDIMKELNWDKYDRLGLTSSYTDHNGNTVKQINDWTKRNDNRHHAMDAITIAFTRPEYINYLNNLNARSDKSGIIYSIQQKFMHRDKNGNLRFTPPMPADKLRTEVKEKLNSVLISTKAKNKVVTTNTATTKSSAGERKSKYLTPRTQLHNETVYSRSYYYKTSEVKVDGNMNAEMINKVAVKAYREALENRLMQFNGDAKKAFTGKNSLKKTPLFIDEAHTQQVPEKVKIVELEPRHTVRVAVSENLNIEKVIDKRVKKILEERIAIYGGNKKEAFANLDTNPIYLNKEKGIVIKKVRINAGVKNVVALHDAHNHLGNKLLNPDGLPIPADFVATSGNHHVALFITPEGKIEEVIVSYFEAVARAIASPALPVIDRNFKSEEGWQFLMTLKKNEYIVFPGYETSDSELHPKSWTK